MFNTGDRIMKKLIFLALLFGCGVAQASLISSEGFGFTTDTDTNLDWLALRLTKGQSAADALVSHNGWRLAENHEVEGLFNALFSGYYAAGVSPELNDFSTYHNLGRVTKYLWRLCSSAC